MGSGTRTLRWLILAVAAAMTLGACSSDTDGAGDAGADPDGVPDVPAEEPSEPQSHAFEVFFTNLELGEIGEVFPVARETSEDELPLAALRELLAGPTAQEQEQGYSSWFSADTAELSVSVRIDDGTASVDLDPRLPEVIPGASTSAGSTALLAELDTTLEQFPEIDRARYRLGGDVAAFYEWLQRAPPDGVGAPGDTDPADDPDGDEEAPPAATARVEVYFTNLDMGADHEVFAVERTVTAPEVLHGALEELLAGPTEAEQEQGYWSWFSAETAGLLDSVRIEDGVAFVHFDTSLPQVIPNASTSAGSAALLAALDATATQFPTVDEAIYSLEGDVDAFYEWLQLMPPA